MSPRTLHLLAQDGVPWRGLGAVALVFGGVVFLVLFGVWVGIRWVIGLLSWLAGDRKGDPWL
jgi:uncharacterized membrane protein